MSIYTPSRFVQSPSAKGPRSALSAMSAPQTVTKGRQRRQTTTSPRKVGVFGNHDGFGPLSRSKLVKTPFSGNLYIAKKADSRLLPYQPTKTRCLSAAKPTAARPNCLASSLMTILYPSALSSRPTSQASKTTSSRLPSDTVLEIKEILSGRMIACSSRILWAFAIERLSASSRTNN
jgi:hypothetical protein